MRDELIPSQNTDLYIMTHNTYSYKVATEIILWLGVTQETVLKGCSTGKAEKYCCRVLNRTVVHSGRTHSHPLMVDRISASVLSRGSTVE